MKTRNAIIGIVLLTVFSLIGRAAADVPFTNLEGVGGIAFNPVAYPAYSPTPQEEKKGDTAVGAKKGGKTNTGGKEEAASLALEVPKEEKQITSWKQNIISKPRLGTWFVRLTDTKINWWTIGVSETLFERLEVSYGYELISPQTMSNKQKHNIGAKLLLLPENFATLQFVPAVSIGTIVKHTVGLETSAKTSGVDGYVVGTKLITQLPRPVLVSVGGLLTQGYTTGVLGYDSHSAAAVFTNVDLLVTDNIAVGFEFKQGAQFENFNNADYWDVHVGWMVNKNLSLIGAWVYAGDQNSTSRVGLGNGMVFSAQYSF